MGIGRIRNRVAASFVLALLAAWIVALPAQAATVRVSCPDCEDIPPWALALLVIVGIVLAMGILWLPGRLARNVASPRARSWIVIGGWLVLTVGFVFGVRLLVVALGGT
jgi:hypothetical protein